MSDHTYTNARPNKSKHTGSMCVAVGCINREGHGIKFHRFPADEARRKQWVVALRRADWTPTPYSKLCAKHFIHGKFKQCIELIRRKNINTIMQVGCLKV